MKKILFTATVDSHIIAFHQPYLKLFKENGWEVHVATNRNAKDWGIKNEFGKYDIPFCDHAHTICIERNPFTLKNIKAIMQMKQLLKNEHFDIIHCHTPMGAVVTRFAAKKARKNGTRVIYTAHGFHFYKRAPFLNWLLFFPVEFYLAKFTDTLITINHEDYNLAKRRFSGRCGDIRYVPGVGINPKKFNYRINKNEKHAIRETLKLKDDDYVIIFPAELSKRKNQIWLINTLSTLLKEDQKIHLLLPGKDSLDGKCQRMAVDFGLEKQIHFLGFRNDIPRLLKISNMAVSSSKQEGLPINIIEEMSINMPIVSLRCRGCDDLLSDYPNGRLVNFDEPEEFTRSIIELRYKKLINENKVANQYYIENVLPLMKRIYGLE